MKKKILLLTASVVVLLITALVLFVLNIFDGSSFVTRKESPKTYYLENADDIDRFERIVRITLYYDGTAELPQPAISSYTLPLCRYTVDDGELLIYEGDAKEAAAVFSVEDKNTLVFKSKTVPLFADIGARYLCKTQN